MNLNRWRPKPHIFLAAIVPLLACTSSFAQVAPQSSSAGSVAIACTSKGHESSPIVASQPASIRGTVTDINDGPIPGAVVILHGANPSDDCSASTNNDGYFEIRNLAPDTSYYIAVSAVGFADWESPSIPLEPGEAKFVNVSKLQILEVQTSVTVSPEDPIEIATEQVKSEEHQRGLLIIPNFYAVYAPNPAPLTARLKFRLSLRVAKDPFTLGGITTYAAAQQAAGNPRYVQGARGYAERLGANTATGFADIMLDGAILPSLLHQDPRYFYKGTGTKKARVLHVFSSLVIARGDNGHLQPNFSSIGGDLASSALANLYYPRANRGVGLVMQGFGVDTAVHVAIRMLGEFAFHPAIARGN